jgi:hypothetical protein
MNGGDVSTSRWEALAVGSVASAIVETNRMKTGVTKPAREEHFCAGLL